MDQKELDVKRRRLNRENLEVRVAVLLVELLRKIDSVSKTASKEEYFEQSKDIFMTYAKRIVARVKELDEY